ncbi:MAG: hypothetical protein JNM99_19570 [Verrucomicrobiaceae bacterium]|nr:hypothetical protein [Verrucomicrobiaceae bacterium]
MNFSKLRSMSLLALFAGVACIAPAAHAATSAEGDLFLGFRATGGTGATKNVVINLGSYSQFTSGSAPTTLSLGTVGADLTAIYGANWNTRSDLFWGIAGSTSAFTTMGVEPAKTLFATRGRPAPATPAIPWTRQSSTAQGTTVSKITSMMGAFNVSTASGGASNGVQQNKSDTNSWGSFQTGGTVANSGPAPGIAFATWNATVDTTPAGTLDLFRLRPATASAPAGTNGDNLGSFSIATSGVVTFTPGQPFYALNNQSISVLESAGMLSVTINREGDLSGSSSVLVSTVNGTAVAGTDFTALSSVLVEFAESETTQTVNIPITSRAGINGSRTFSVQLSGPVASALGSSSSAQITITESESSFAFASSTATVSEAAGSVVLTINRTGRTDVANSVTVSTVNGTGLAGTDFTIQTATSVSFAIGETSKTISIPMTNRPGIRASRTFSAGIDAVTSPRLLGSPSTATVTITEADAQAAMTGPSSSATPYLRALNNNWNVTAVTTVGDTVPKTGGGTYQLSGLADGLGAYDNGNGTFTLLVNHEIGTTLGSVRAHGAVGAFVSEWIINKSTLAVVSANDLITSVYGWDATNQVSNASTGTFAFNRLCSADLPPVSAFYNATSGLGTQNRIFLNGEEGGANGWVLANVATGADKGKSFILGKFNTLTNGSGGADVGGWENILASPFAQDKTVVIGTNDGGTGIMTNNVSVYVGTKTNTGTDADKAGLTNGTLKFIAVTGFADNSGTTTDELSDTTTRTTAITSGTAFTLSTTVCTTFSRPEDGAWDPTNPNRFYFVTTDRLDQATLGLGTQIGRTRLWRLNFTDITNPDLGGTIDLLATGGVGNDATMWDNLCVTGDGKLVIQEDPGNTAHNAKVWFYDPATGSLTKALQHDPARFGSTSQPATAPFNADEESSGVIDVTAMFGGNHTTGQRYYLIADQSHYSIAAPMVEGGQLLLVQQTAAQTGPSSSATPYLVSMHPDYATTSITTVGDNVPKTGGGTYQMSGLADGLGVYDNGNGTVTLLVNHEIGNTLGVARAHGAIGGFVSEWIINKNTLAVVSAGDLITSVYGWDATNQVSNSTTGTFAFNRPCSADLPPVTAFYNAASGLGTQERIYMNGEEGGANGWALANVATGANKGKTYILGKFNLSTNGSGLTAVGGWENLLANPFAQDKTVVIGTNDGGTGIMANAVSVYVGTKTNTGTEADKAGLTNGVQKFINVTGNAAEIVDATTRATNITSGTRFSLSATTSTVFSRPEDGAWNPSNPREFYFVTTDRIDTATLGLGSQIGRTRLWKLTFDDITNPDLGGSIDLLLTGGIGNDANMWDNLCVTYDGKLMLQEDPGNTPHNAKVWSYDPVTGTLTKVLRHDTARFGDNLAGVTTAATAPFTQDEESSGVIDVTAMFGGNTAAGEHVYFVADQAHYSITGALVEGGQLLLVRHTPRVAFSLASAVAAVNENAGPVTLTINRFGDLAQPATASVTTTNGTALSGTDYTALSSFAVNFAAGESTKNVNVTITDRLGAGAATRVFYTFVAGTAPTDATTGAPAVATITINSVATPVQSWRQTYFGTTANSGLTADTADYDGDGVSNLLEYGLGLNPTVAGVAGLPVGVSGSVSDDPLLADRLYLSFSIPQSAPADVTYTVRATDSLGTWTDVARKIGNGSWTWLGGGTSRLFTSVQAPYQLLKVGDLVPRNSTNTRRFMQLQVTTP